MTTSRLALWAIPVADLAGVARHVTDVARNAVPGWQLVFLVPPGPLADELHQLGADVRVERFGPDHGLRASCVSLRRAVSDVRPAVIHSHLSYADIVVALAAPRGARLISTEHGIARDDQVYHGSKLEAKVMAAVHRARVRRFRQIIAVSEATAEAIVAKWSPSRRRPPRVIRNGVIRTRAERCDATSARVASIARLAPEKGIGAAIEAFAVVHDLRPDAQLTIGGEGPLLGELQAQVADAGLADAVKFAGHVAAGELLKTTDVLVQLSVWENCSYSLLDAVNAGCGVVATDVGGNSELLPPSCLVERAASPESVASLILQQADDIAARPILPADWPDVDEMCAAIAGVYEEVAG